MVKFQVPNSITFRDMNYYPVTDGQTESDAYEPTVQYAQVGSKTAAEKKFWDNTTYYQPMLFYTRWGGVVQQNMSELGPFNF